MSDVPHSNCFYRIKMDNIIDRQRVSVNEMKDYYTTLHPFAPNNRRVGQFAKKMGFRLVRQMINRKYEYFYIKTN